MQLQKVEIGYEPDYQRLLGLKFYSKDGAVVLQTESNWVAYRNCTIHTVHLEEGERVIGYKSRFNSIQECHHEFKLIIGRLI